ncbi:TPA: hypothetical protein ACP32N_003271 [Pseudomonas aeruginosa]
MDSSKLPSDQTQSPGADSPLVLLNEAGLQVTIQAVVISCRWFMAEGKRVATVTVLGNKDGPMGSGMQCRPYPIFELDADYSVYEALADRLNPPEADGEPTPIRASFRADLKPISIGGRYVTHLLEVLPGE